MLSPFFPEDPSYPLRRQMLLTFGSVPSLAILVVMIVSIIASITTVITVATHQEHASSSSFVEGPTLSNDVTTNIINATQPKTMKLSPKRWRTFSYQDLHTFFQCPQYDTNNDHSMTSIHKKEQWNGLHQYYHKIFPPE